MKVQVLHMRDPDMECGVEVYVDGVKVDVADLEDIDPGRGYQWSDTGWSPDDEEWGWKGRLIEARDAAVANPDDAFAAACYQWLLSATESKYIEGKPEDWHEQITGAPTA